jgi:thiosulfate/3-mercaptopyruvate sulfurtransferase
MDSTLNLSIKILNKKTNEQLIDARPHLRYLGQVEEPRACRIKGHIPGAKSVYFKNLIDENFCMKSTEELKKEFEKQEVKLDNDITVYCGSGVTASVDILALTLLGKFDVCKIYDGSWSEYGNIPADNEKYLELEKLKQI